MHLVRPQWKKVNPYAYSETTIYLPSSIVVSLNAYSETPMDLPSSIVVSLNAYSEKTI